MNGDAVTVEKELVMDEMIAGSDQGLGTSVSQPAQADVKSENVPHRTLNETHSPEKTFTQTEVNEIAGRVRHEAIERYKRSADSQQSRSFESQVANLPIEQQREELKRLVAAETQRQWDERIRKQNDFAAQQEAEKVANDFSNKMSAGKDKYQDFDETFADFEFHVIPNIVRLANGVDNTADVMYELAKNPSKIASLQELMRISPKLAQRQMQELSKSIKDNEAAKNVRTPTQPLSTLRPSNTGIQTGADHKKSVSDYRKIYR